MNFDYLRLFFAVTVMTAHAGDEILQFGQLWKSEMALIGFFCISGYLITNSFLEDRNIGSYAKKRFARIYPPIAAVVVVMMGFGLLMDFDQTYMRVVFSMALFQDWLVLFLDNQRIFAHGAFWTLVVEAQFYLALPFVIVAWRKWPRRTLALLVVLHFASHFSRRYLASDLLLSAFRDNLFTFAHFFIAGVVAAIYCRKITDKHWFWWAIVPASMAVYGVVQLHGDNYLTHLMPIAIMAMILAVASLLGRITKRKSAYWGDISYGIYLYHFPVIFILKNIGVRYGIFVATPINIMVVTTAVSFASWWLLEKPILNLVKSSSIRSSGIPGITAVEGAMRG